MKILEFIIEFLLNAFRITLFICIVPIIYLIKFSRWVRGKSTDL